MFYFWHEAGRSHEGHRSSVTLAGLHHQPSALLTMQQFGGQAALQERVIIGALPYEAIMRVRKSPHLSAPRPPPIPPCALRPTDKNNCTRDRRHYPKLYTITDHCLYHYTTHDANSAGQN
ncbi:hypothetical protein O0L34_g11694 [Tuta absoluta]|nr:hypothetical protein O0L34_g11694 [Tuta absoluta]